ncbi:hypothetical protein FNF27_07902 [Cafeteria roenbergensis]|uniref:J domain-containing protein n=2 Tax=Cafeteria roenbergensis TaxID=33653 RepID=A0A5A8CLC9_CAFRO|nr:hypothetical protein FNF31_07539 [Cafeteria roenbergensis]KAA0150910.1 hypothetical protein FNF28_07201 [Cafeteria roenbergensis]KAA0153933.1 hypothetical protein FNF29_02921 [Cafeteria roenbergensis]KAA0163701.1 hypothetical protein FNF27_07902 [Cafeteria roenbergensis]|eukprot:KAA0153933.1 hypothetical protein FNF29_02921 [Cafeteria roenbergensis]
MATSRVLSRLGLRRVAAAAGRSGARDPLVAGSLASAPGARALSVAAVRAPADVDHAARVSPVARSQGGGLAPGDLTRKALFHASARSEVVGPLVAGLSVAAGAIVIRYGIEAYNRMASMPVSKTSTVRKNYKGPFEDAMSRREAALILGCRESSNPDTVRARHRKLLIKNHPDRGGSTFISIKVNEAKAVLLGEKNASS